MHLFDVPFCKMLIKSSPFRLILVILSKMNYNLATHNEYLISIYKVRPRLSSIFAKIHKAQRAENFSGAEQNSSRIRVSEQNFEQNKQFLRALPAGRIRHFTSGIYPSLFL